jgi:transposase
MARYKRYDYSQTVLLPVSLEEQLMPGTLEFAIHRLVETRMDLSRFAERFHNDETGRSAYDPKILLKIVLLAYARGIVSSRKMERACRENVVFMALTCGQYPDHSTIAAFISSMQEEIVLLFRDVLLVCDEMKLLGGTEFALDGCKLPSNASKEWSGTLADLWRKQEKIEQKVRQLCEAHIAADGSVGEDKTEQQQREGQIKRLEQIAQRITAWLAGNREKIGTRGEAVKSNITDNESAKMVSSHGVIQGYNAQALVDGKHGVIVHGEALGSGQDHGHVPPLVDGAKENLIAIGKDEDCLAGAVFTADTNYHSEVNIKKCEQEQLDAYIPDRYFRQRDPRFATQERHGTKREKKFTRDDFQYDAERDQYLCPQGEVLRRTAKKINAQGTFYRQYCGSAGYCGGCVVRRRCIKNKGGRYKYLQIPIGTAGRNYSQEMAAKVDTERGRKMYPHRIAIVEPVFANLRTHKGLNRFTLRGRIKVTIQWLLYCMVHNIEKIAHCGLDLVPA